MPPCQHPPARLFTWFAFDGVGRGRYDRTDLCIACCDCGAVLAGAGSGSAQAQRHQPCQLASSIHAGDPPYALKES